jgi:hypothetical protein
LHIQQQNKALQFPHTLLFAYSAETLEPILYNITIQQQQQSTDSTSFK